MKRKFELVDLMVLIGMVATVFGSYAFFQVTDSGAVSISTEANHMTHHPIKAFVQAKLQPAMGQIRVCLNGSSLLIWAVEPANSLLRHEQRRATLMEG